MDIYFLYIIIRRVVMCLSLFFKRLAIVWHEMSCHSIQSLTKFIIFVHYCKLFILQVLIHKSKKKYSYPLLQEIGSFKEFFVRKLQ